MIDLQKFQNMQPYFNYNNHSQKSQSLTHLEGFSPLPVKKVRSRNFSNNMESNPLAINKIENQMDLIKKNIEQVEYN